MQIPTNIYGLELLRWVCQTPELTTDDVVIREAIKHLCFPNMLVFDSQIFTEEECRYLHISLFFVLLHAKVCEIKYTMKYIQP